MDKRTILFVLALSLSLFLVNIFFQYQNVQKKQEWVKQQQQKKEAQKEIKSDRKIDCNLPASLRPTKKGEEKFYVLETPYQQLVFSTSGGALAEINLPFQTKENEKSVVREIEFDREMIKSHPDNAYFPSHPYYTPSLHQVKNRSCMKKGNLGDIIRFCAAILIEKAPQSKASRSSLTIMP